MCPVGWRPLNSPGRLSPNRVTHEARELAILSEDTRACGLLHDDKPRRGLQRIQYSDLLVDTAGTPGGV